MSDYLRDAVAGAGLTGGADDALVGADGDVTFTIGAGDGINVDADDVDVDQTYNFAWTGVHSWTNTVTDSGALQDINITLGADANTDTVAGIQIDATSFNTGDPDILAGLLVNNLTSPDGIVNEYGIYQAGTNWDYGIYVEDTALFNTTVEINGNTIGLNLDADANNLLAYSAASAAGGAAADDLYWGDKLLCDASAGNCGWATSGFVSHSLVLVE